MTPRTPHELHENPPLDLVAASVELEAAAPESEADNRPRRFRMVAYTGGPMNLSGWRYPVVVDLAGLDVGKPRRPILLDHTRDVDFVMGQTDEIAIQDHQLIVAGEILGDSPKARQVIALADRGFAWQASIGARAEQVEFVPESKTVEVNGREFSGPVNVARRSRLGEVSFVVLGADDNTSAKIAASKEQNMEFAEWVQGQGFAPESLTEQQTTNLTALFEASRTPETPPQPREPESDPIADFRARMAAERKRVSRIQEICAGHGELEARAIVEGWDETRTELEVLRASRPKGPVIHSEDGSGRSAQSLEAALCLSAGLPESQVGSWYDEKAMNAAVSRDLRGAGLHTLLYETIRAAGLHARPGRVDNDVIHAAFVGNNRLIQGSSGFSTISLSGILGNVANKTMLAAYTALNAVAPQICAATDVNDFKQVTRYRMTASGIFQKVGPDGELKHAELDEESYTNQIDTYGRMIALTRQMIINDDLGAFLQIPRAIGRMSVLALEEAVFTLLLSNPNSFFSTNNKNYFEGADSALDIDSLTTGEQKFLDRTDSKGKPILVQPALLVVPTSLKVTAEHLFKETQVNQVPANNKAKPATNPHAGKFRPVASPYLSLSSITGNSTTAWYLLAEPTDVAAMEIAYLRGRRTPTIESGETDFNTLGMQWRGYFDFGVAMQDHRAAVKSKGAA